MEEKAAKATAARSAVEEVHKSRQDALARAEESLARETREAEEEHRQFLESKRAPLDQAEEALAQADRDHRQLLELKTAALAQAKAALEEARKREGENLALEKTELVKRNDLEEEGGWLARRKARNRAAARLDEIEANTQALVEDAVTFESQVVVAAEEDLATVGDQAFATETKAVAKAKAAFDQAQQAPMREVEDYRFRLEIRRSELRSFDNRLVQVRRLYDAHEHWKQTRQDQDWLEAEKIAEQVKADASAKLEFQAQEVERLSDRLKGTAELQAAAAEQATGLLNREKRRLARRALAARRRRAREAGVELVEPEDTHP